MPLSTPMERFRDEKDSLAFLGLLARAYLLFDPPIPRVGAEERFAPTHFHGLNIHACVVDNLDGEVLGIDHNTMHEDESPLQHAEQRAIRTAIARTRTKRPRGGMTAVETYYIEKMFTSPSTEPRDYFLSGATAYTTLEPCPMCSTTLLVARVKRTVFILRDEQFGGAFPAIKKKYYQPDESDSIEKCYGQLEIRGETDFTREVARLNRTFQAKAGPLQDPNRKPRIPSTHVLDHLRSMLESAFDMLREVTPAQFDSGEYQARNVLMLRQLKKACNLPDLP